MPLDPELQALVDGVSRLAPVDYAAVTPEEFRARFLEHLVGLGRPRHATPLPLAAIEDRTMPGPGGPLALRVFRPAGADDGRPRAGLVFLHGGGWVMGDIAGHDGVCRPLCHATDAVVVSVDYRVAPSHPYPAALDDAAAALEWVAADAGALGIDPTRLGVAGDSAGANLAAALALRARDTGGPALVAQVLVCAPLDLTCTHAASAVRGPESLLNADAIRWMSGQYLAGHAPTDPYASPLHAPDLTGLPPAVVATAEFDPLRDEGRAYAARLAAAGVPVEALDFPGLVHGFVGLRSLSLAAIAASDEVWAAVRRLLEPRSL
ncbi:MAG TPA: alpha/beta hydrolase [Acidimicrobiales bacterium]|nr:alpha/beta hydrolase [Acidimicrobiales bacterium]